MFNNCCGLQSYFLHLFWDRKREALEWVDMAYIVIHNSHECLTVK